MYVAVDLLSVMLPTKVYLAIIEKLHPNEPPIRAIQSVVATLSAAEKKDVATTAKHVAEYANAVAQAAGAGH